jgi:RNA methyltransferase, TrmH family
VISKNKIKLIKSLEYKKFRSIHQLFVAEGNKLVTDLLKSGYEIVSIMGTREYIAKVEQYLRPGIELFTCSREEIQSASLQKSPQDALALCRIPQYHLDDADPRNNLIICLDNIQDPGNLGTIIRIADWFGIRDVVCSNDTTDSFNPKTVQATMGSVSRVRVHYTELIGYLSSEFEKKTEIIGALMEGDSIFTQGLSSTGILLMGNEGKGISDDLLPFISKKVTIPHFSKYAEHAESLNVAVATAICCAEIRRRDNPA